MKFLSVKFLYIFFSKLPSTEFVVYIGIFTFCFDNKNLLYTDFWTSVPNLVVMRLVDRKVEVLS